MRILLYGGCHAYILHILLDELVDRNEVEICHLINFQLIASGKPFPAELLDWCDALVFSPIENKELYNTDLLRQECRSRGVQALAFPWLEWHGYSPGAVKGDFKGRFQWFFPQLAAMADTFSSFGAFRDHVVERFPDDETIDSIASQSGARLAAAEERHEMAIRVSEFIGDHHQASRLFLIADHPSLAIYRHVIGQIADRLDIALSPMSRTDEPQWRWRTPILPRVRDRLGLAFTDPAWVDDEMIPGQVFDLETYLSLYYYKDGVILGPNASADIRFPSEPLLPTTPVQPDTRIFANPVNDDDGSGLATYDILTALSGSGLAVPPQTRFAIEPMHWRSTWQF